MGPREQQHEHDAQQLRQRAEAAEAQQTAAQQLQEQQPAASPPPFTPADCPAAPVCDLEPSNAAIAACELRVTELTALHDTAASSLASLQAEHEAAASSLTSLQAEHDAATAAATVCQSEKAEAEQQAEQKLSDALVAETETAKQRLAESEAQSAQQLAVLREETERLTAQLQAVTNVSCECPTAAAASPAPDATPLPAAPSDPEPAPLSDDKSTAAPLPASPEQPADSASASPSPPPASAVSSNDSELVSVTLDASGAVLDCGECERERSEQEALLLSLRPELQRLREERDAALSASTEASTQLALMQSELAALEIGNAALQAAFSALNASVDDERQRLQEEAAESAADGEALREQAAALLVLQEERDALSNRTAELEAAALQLEESSRQAELRLQELEAAGADAELRLQEASGELARSRQAADELRAAKEMMQLRLEAQLSEAEQELQSSRQRSREEAGTLQLLDLLLAQLQEAESGIESLSSLLSELTANSSQSMSADELQQLESGLQQLSASSAANAGAALAAAQLELIQLRVNVSRLSDDNAELSTDVERLQQQVEALESAPPAPLPSVNATASGLPAAVLPVPSGLELEQLRAQCDDAAQRLQAEADISSRSLRDCVTKSAQLQAEMGQAAQRAAAGRGLAAAASACRAVRLLLLVSCLPALLARHPAAGAVRLLRQLVAPAEAAAGLLAHCSRPAGLPAAARLPPSRLHLRHCCAVRGAVGSVRALAAVRARAFLRSERADGAVDCRQPRSRAARLQLQLLQTQAGQDTQRAVHSARPGQRQAAGLDSASASAPRRQRLRPAAAAVSGL